MKLTRSVILLLSICMLGFNACKKDSTKASTLTMTVGGTVKTSTAAAAFYNQSGDKSTVIVAKFSDTEDISITIPTIAVTSYDITSGGTVVVAYTDPTRGYTGVSGKVTITSVNGTEIKGTFNITCSALVGSTQAVITGGDFDVAVTAL